MSKYEPQHMGLRERVSGWSRRRKIAAGVGGFTFATLAGVALALLLARGEFFGGGSVTATPDLRFHSVTALTGPGTSQGALSCSGTVAGDQQSVTLDIQLVSDGWCDLELGTQLVNNPPGGMKYQNVRFASTGITASFVGGCGAMVSPSLPPQPLRIRFTATPSFAGPVTVSADAGVEVVSAADYVPGSCPSAS